MKNVSLRTEVHIISIYLLFAVMALGCLTHRGSATAAVQSDRLLWYVLSYSGFSLLSNSARCRKIMEPALTAAIAVLCLRESVIGMMQTVGVRASGHQLFLCTGSFGNPGPYGGFLAVSASVLAAALASDAPGHGPIRKGLRVMYAVSAFSALAILPASMSRAATVASGISLAVMAFRSERLKIAVTEFRQKHRILSASAAALAVICCTAFMAMAYNAKKDSADGRLFMAGICLKAMAESPLSGHGPGSFAHAYGDAQFRHFAEGDFTERERMLADCPEYAFNTYLGTGVEYGIPAMMLLIVAVITGISASIRQKSPFGYGLLAIAVFAMFSYPQEIAVFRLLMPLTAASAGIPGPERSAPGWLRTAIFAAVLPAVLWYGHTRTIPRILAERKWHDMEHSYAMAEYGNVARRYAPLLLDMKHSQRFMFQYGHALFRTGQYGKCLEILEEGRGISCDAMFWNLCGEAHQALGDCETAEECYRHAFLMVPNRLYPLCLTARLHYECGDSIRLDEVRRYIASFRPKKESEAVIQLRKDFDVYIRSQSPERNRSPRRCDSPSQPSGHSAWQDPAECDSLSLRHSPRSSD